MRELTAGENENGQRLDKTLRRFLPMAGNGFIYKMMRKKNIVLNGKRCHGDERLVSGDTIRLYLADETIDAMQGRGQEKAPNAQKHKETNDLSSEFAGWIVYEDAQMIAVNKPCGILSQRANPGDTSLIEYLTDYLIKVCGFTEDNFLSYRPGVCNRLDRNTSGLILIGKTLPAAAALNQMIRERSVKKLYQTIAVGRIDEKRHLEGVLTKDEKTRRVDYRSDAAKSGRFAKGASPAKNTSPAKGAMTDKNDQQGERAERVSLDLRPLIAEDAFSLLEIDLHTGKSHQIRAQLSAIGHPILGDPKYGDPKINRTFRESDRITHQLLHAGRMVFPEEIEGELSYLSGREITAPKPKDFEQLEQRLFHQ